MRDQDVLDGEREKCSQRRSHTFRTIAGSQPGVRTHSKLSGLPAHKHVARDQRPLLRKPDHDLVEPSNREWQQPARQLLAAGDGMIEGARRCRGRRRHGPNRAAISVRGLCSAPLVPEASSYDRRAGPVPAHQLVKDLPVFDKRINDHQADGRSRSPPRDFRVPAVFSAVCLRPTGMLLHESEQPAENFARTCRWARSRHGRRTVSPRAGHRCSEATGAVRAARSESLCATASRACDSARVRRVSGFAPSRPSDSFARARCAIRPVRQRQSRDNRVLRKPAGVRPA